MTTIISHSALRGMNNEELVARRPRFDKYECQDGRYDCEGYQLPTGPFSVPDGISYSELMVDTFNYWVTYCEVTRRMMSIDKDFQKWTNANPDAGKSLKNEKTKFLEDCLSRTEVDPRILSEIERRLRREQLKMAYGLQYPEKGLLMFHRHDFNVRTTYLIGHCLLADREKVRKAAHDFVVTQLSKLHDDDRDRFLEDFYYMWATTCREVLDLLQGEIHVCRRMEEHLDDLDRIMVKTAKKCWENEERANDFWTTHFL